MSFFKVIFLYSETRQNAGAWEIHADARKAPQKAHVLISFQKEGLLWKIYDDLSLIHLLKRQPCLLSSKFLYIISFVHK